MPFTSCASCNASETYSANPPPTCVFTPGEGRREVRARACGGARRSHRGGEDRDQLGRGFKGVDERVALQPQATGAADQGGGGLDGAGEQSAAGAAAGRVVGVALEVAGLEFGGGRDEDAVRVEV